MVNTIESDCDQGTNEQYELVFTVAQALAAPVRKYELLDLNGVSDLDGFTVEREVQLRKKLSNLDGEQLHNLQNIYSGLEPISQVILQRLATNFDEMVPVHRLYPGYTEGIHIPDHVHLAVSRLRKRLVSFGFQIYSHTNYWCADSMLVKHSRGGRLEYVLVDTASVPEWWFPWPDGTEILPSTHTDLAGLTNFLCEVTIATNSRLLPRYFHSSKNQGSGLGAWLLYKRLAAVYPEPVSTNIISVISKNRSGNNFHVFKSKCLSQLNALLDTYGLFRLHVNRKLGLIYLTKQ